MRDSLPAIIDHAEPRQFLAAYVQIDLHEEVQIDLLADPGGSSG